MTDPERISKRSMGLAPELLRAAHDEQPGDAGMQRTLAALGVASAILSTTSVAGAALAGTKTGVAAATGTTHAISAVLLVKWIGIGVVGGIGVAGVAALASAPAPQPLASSASAQAPRVNSPASAQPATPTLTVTAPSAAEPSTTASSAVSAPRPSVLAAPELETGAPLAAEVALVDRARSLLASGKAEQGLALLARYEHEFSEARLLPEVLFLQLQTLERLSRNGEARRAAQRLVEGFPKSPHAARARKLLSQ